MSRQRAPIVGDEDAVQEELNPFSFKEFLRQKETQQEQGEQEVQEQLEEQQEEVGRRNTAGPPLRPRPSLTCLASEGQSGRSFSSGGTRGSTHWTEADEEKSRPGGAAGGAEGAPTRGGGAVDGGESHENDSEPAASSCRSSLMQQLQEENAALRRSVEELQRSAAASENKAAQLQEELLQTRRREEKEAQDLENMVQSVEHNLRLMTKRAVKAESCVSKLKSELQQLQADLVCVRSENNSLKAAESEVVMTMRQNARVASEYLSKTASHAHSSIQKLLGEAESLRLVSELLCSIDKISTVDTES